MSAMAAAEEPGASLTYPSPPDAPTMRPWRMIYFGAISAVTIRTMLPLPYLRPQCEHQALPLHVVSEEASWLPIRLGWGGPYGDAAAAAAAAALQVQASTGQTEAVAVATMSELLSDDFWVAPPTDPHA
mmetsp:Transcript_23722/g.61632  ORF Transcript_23722/g.61632 Transcript_23722/m.61632 type:complete len:129 (-) Transcript_23722:229-615(-)